MHVITRVAVGTANPQLQMAVLGELCLSGGTTAALCQLNTHTLLVSDLHTIEVHHLLVVQPIDHGDAEQTLILTVC